MKPNHQEQRQFSLDGGSVLIDERKAAGLPQRDLPDPRHSGYDAAGDL